MSLDDDSAGWLARLTGSGRVRNDAYIRLHQLLLAAARSDVNRRGPALPVIGVEADDLAHQAAADAMIAILSKLGTFRGDSRFTTWAYKFVMIEVSAKIGRHFWQRPVLVLDQEDWERMPARFGFTPTEQAEAGDLLGAVRHAVEHELTDLQRRVFTALTLEGVPLDALAARLGSSRNAIYKVMFDARMKLHAALAAKGYLP